MLNTLLLLVVEVIFFWITVKCDLELTLTSQVLQDGQIVLIGIDKNHIELLRLHIDRTGI